MTDSLTELATRLEHERADIVAASLAAVYGELPSYAAVPRADVERSLGYNVGRAIRTLAEGAAPSTATSQEAAATTRERAGQGVPIEDIIRAYRICLRVIHDRFVELADSRGVPAAEVLRGSTLLWAVGDWFTAGVAIQYQARSIDEAVRRSAFLRDVFDGSGVLENTVGLEPGRYSVALALADEHADRVVRALGEAGGIAGRVGDTVVAVLAHPPSWGEGVLAVGPAVEVLDLRSSADLARRVLALVRDRQPGVYGIPELSWRLAAVDPAVSAHLAAIYLAPLESQGEFGELVIGTVRTYLACDRRVKDAARELHVHQNTLRYRLARFEEAVGRSLESTETLVGLAWALESRRL